MSLNSFLKGVGVGMAAGAVLTAIASPSKKKNMHVIRGRAGKAIRAIGDVMESITENFT